MAEELRVSLTQFSEGGQGLPSNQDMEIVGALFIRHDWKNKDGVAQGKPAPVLKLDLKLEDGSPYTDYLSAGSLDYFVPSIDGTGLVRVGAIEQVGKQFDYARFMHSLIEHGLDPAKVDTDITQLVGVVFHGVREQTGQKRKDKNGKEWPITCLVASEIKATPWDAKKGSKASGKAAEANADVEAVAKTAAVKVVKDAGGSIEFKKLGIKVFAALNKTDKANAGPASKLLGNEDFVLGMAQEGLVEFDGDKVSLA